MSGREQSVQLVLDKAGGMPTDRKYGLRSAIERWALDDWAHWGVPERRVVRMNYVEVFCGYWKRYHYQMALSGIMRMPTTQVIPYGHKYMTDAVRHWYKEFEVNGDPEPFKEAQPPAFLPEEEAVAEKVLDDVARFWASLDLKFPVEELSRRY